MSDAIQVALFDCDGVLQHPALNFVDGLAALGGPNFPWAVFDAELPALRGEVSLESILAEVVAAQDVSCSVGELLTLWDHISVDEAAWSVVDDVRALGVQVALATNQQDYRAGRMRASLGYDERVDHSFYSCDLGACKPEPEFFLRILEVLDVPAAATLFIDDSAGNVEVADRLGLHVIHHDPSGGATALRRELHRFVPGLS